MEKAPKKVFRPFCQDMFELEPVSRAILTADEPNFYAAIFSSS